MANPNVPPPPPTTRAEAEQQARVLINKWVTGATALSWIPGSSLVLSAADAAMISQVGRLFGVTNFEMTTIFGAAGTTGLAKTAVVALEFFPGPGWLLKAMIAGGATKVLGETILRYFRDRSPLPLTAPPPPPPSTPTPTPAS
jgi:uncharacterized protein (DUF697 family)